MYVIAVNNCHHLTSRDDNHPQSDIADLRTHVHYLLRRREAFVIAVAIIPSRTLPRRADEADGHHSKGQAYWRRR